MGLKDFIPLKEMISLKGKVALITGSASGIGEAIAYRFAEAGADLFLVDINEENLKRVSEAISSRFGIKVENYVVDLSKKEDIDKLWESLKDKEPDILVNN
ncbi:MAG: SDR family NAD(P)-dependent oxidoreductase, partial [Caldisphaeraceae archaeon]|nr:SDR family NAD(P)-dependent oxidoreductase [Caldisphaeraceae archaeon]